MPDTPLRMSQKAQKALADILAMPPATREEVANALTLDALLGSLQQGLIPLSSVRDTLDALLVHEAARQRYLLLEFMCTMAKEEGCCCDVVAAATGERVTADVKQKRAILKNIADLALEQGMKAARMPRKGT